MRFFRVFALVLCVVAAVPGIASAQTGKKVVRVADPLDEELSALIYSDAASFRVAYSMLARSFAAHLHGDTDGMTADTLSTHSAAYDPASGPALAPGIVLFHLARPLDIMEGMDNFARKVQVRVLTYRLHWMAGDPEKALSHANALIEDLRAVGVEDALLPSVLADAAVLALRAGDRAGARTLFASASACGEQFCPRDLIFAMMNPRSRKQDAPPDYSAEAMRDAALSRAKIMFPGNDEIAAQILLEYDYVTGRALESIRKMLDLAASTENSGILTSRQRRDMRHMALRLANFFDFETYFLTGDSVAETVTWLDGDTGRLPTDSLRKVNYLSDKRLSSKDNLMRRAPLFVLLLQHGDQRGDAVVAEAIRIRLLLNGDAWETAKTALQRLIAQSRADGFSDSELHSIWMDLWAVAILTGDTATAQEAEHAVLPCITGRCRDDLNARFFESAAAAKRMAWMDGMLDLSIRFAEPMVRDLFPGNGLLIADLYDAIGDAEDFPMDAARRALLSFRIAEGARDIAPMDLVFRAARAMETLIYAGDYDGAADLADRVVSRVGEAEATILPFLKNRARAAFRIGDRRAEGFYRATVRHALALGSDTNDIALDLMDTGYLDVLDQLAAGTTVEPGVLARLRFRQGRPADAADILMQARRALEGADKAVETLADYLSKKAERLRAGGQTRLSDEALERRQAVLDAGRIDEDEPLFYESHWWAAKTAYQEAFYRDAAGDPAGAEALRTLAFLNGPPAVWVPLDDVQADADIAVLMEKWGGSGWPSYSYNEIRDLINLRDSGYFEAAEMAMRGHSTLARAAEINGTYVDAQTLWQMAFTFARVGEANEAFDLMNRAARLAANLSFEGAGGANGGTLQLLERDRWRYLLFVDIAWAAVLGQAPETMSVVSRY